MQNNNLINEFNNEVFDAIEESKRIGYIPTRFIQMLHQSNNNAVDVVQRLVTKEATSGLEKLWEKGRLELSMEAIIIKTKYNDLFPAEIINHCTKKLKKFGYKI